MNDIKLNYIEQGAGEPLILLHGNGGNCGYFERQMPFFSKMYRTFAIDTRGHGQSPRGSAPFTLSTFADDLADFMAEHGIKKARIIGFSDGANIAMTFVLKYGVLVQKLVLDGGNLFPSGLKGYFMTPCRIGYALLKPLSARSRWAKSRFELLRLMVDEPDISPDQLSAIDAPALVVAGTRDIVKEPHTRLIARSIPGAQLCILDGPHSVARTDSAAFNSAVADFLK